MNEQTTPLPEEEEIYVSAQITNDLCPVGTWPAVCVDVRNGGVKEGVSKAGRPYSMEQVYLVWQVFPSGDGVPTHQDDGRPFQVDRAYTANLNYPSDPNSTYSNLRNDLESWRGAKYTPDEVQKFRLNNVKGQACLLEVIENVSNGKIYANVASVLPHLDKDGKRIKLEIQTGYVPIDYVARAARKAASNQPAQMTTTQRAPVADDSVPF